MTIHLNYVDDEIVSSPTVLIKGSVVNGPKAGIVQISNNSNQVFPPQFCELNNGHFRALVHVSEEANKLHFEVISNGYIGGNGHPGYYQGGPQVVEDTSITIFHSSLPENKPVHLCVIVGRDSKGVFDMPAYKRSGGEVANLDTAIQKLKVAGRLMQAFTQDELRSTGLSNRCFQFTEMKTSHQRLFGYDMVSPTPHSEVNIHILRSDKTVTEIRDPDLAQQNPKAKNNGGLFTHAIDLIKGNHELMKYYTKQGSPIQCAVLYLDAHYDVKSDMILGHAALGGGCAEAKVAIFGSHGIHSWPTSFNHITPCFMDQTQLTKREVANDNNECGTSWECLNVTLGAFMHEIGHLLGSPHQVDGVMLRDYVWWNRSFMTREQKCLRTKTNQQLIPSNGEWMKVCHWNKLDLIRFLYHDSFSIPTDAVDETFEKVDTTRMNRTRIQPPTIESVSASTAYIKSQGGIFMVELVVKDLARCEYLWYPQSYGGSFLPKEIKLNYYSCLNTLKSRSKEVSDDFDVRVLASGGDLFIKNFKDRVS